MFFILFVISCVRAGETCVFCFLYSTKVFFLEGCGEPLPGKLQSVCFHVTIFLLWFVEYFLFLIFNILIIFVCLLITNLLMV